MSDDNIIYKLGAIEATVKEHGGKLSEVVDELKSMNSHMSDYNAQLAEHMAQTRLVRDLATAALKATGENRADFDGRFDKVSEEIKPLRDHVVFVGKATKIVVWMLAVPGCVYYLLKIITEFVR